MNRQTIIKLWNGELEPYAHLGEGNAELEGLEEEIRFSYEKLEKNLDSKTKKLLDEYRDNIDNYTVSTNEQAFCEGFCLGTRLTAEALTDE